MNIQLSAVTVTAKDGRGSKLQHCYIRGSKVRFIVLPDMLKNAPMFKRFDPKQAKSRSKIMGIGRGSMAQAGHQSSEGFGSAGRGGGRGGFGRR
jgi:small nuclear ribonucleoprotein D3